MKPRIFLSVANREHEAFRIVLRDQLTRTRFFDVVVQPDFAHSAADTVRKLDREIAGCELLIHIVGRDPGSRANTQSVADFFAHTAREQFLAQLPNARTPLGDFTPLTYFQWEPWLALHRKIAVLVYAVAGHAHAGFAQRDHLDALAIARCHADTLQDSERRCGQIIADVCAHFGIIPAQPQRIADTRLVSRHTAADFIGRADELKLLDAAWVARDRVNVQCVIAWGGVGKTALLARWVQTRFRDCGWKNAEGQPEPQVYFDWTFYDQGTRADDATHAGAASIGLFFVEALQHFGDPEPNRPDDKARRLAKQVQAQRSLLVLDGLEPLQYPHNHPQAGQITDPDLAQFLRLLAQRNPGLCLVTSREGLRELGGQLASNAPHHDLEDLPTAAAVALLRKLGVIGSDADLAKAVADYRNHALSLILLGRFLAVARGGDIRQRDTVSFEKADSKRSAQTRSAWHVLETTERWLGTPGGHATDLQALRLIGLFERPASPDCLDALRQAPAIAGLTDRLVPLGTDEWNAVLKRLHEAQLIQLNFPPRDPAGQAPYPEPRRVSVDAHPLVREYFANRLRESHPGGFQAAHSRLFDHLCQTTPHWPDTLEGLQPLYQAVVHGCLAERQPEANTDVYLGRILRGDGPDGFYSTFKLGAVGADLSAVSAFFLVHWSKISSNLTELTQAWLLNEAAFSLRALGRLTEGLDPLVASGVICEKLEDWPEAAIRYSNLSEFKMYLGELGSALADARLAIRLAELSNDWIEVRDELTTVADILHQLGERDEARLMYEQAEGLQRKHNPELKVLYALRGFRYCDLILSCAEIGAWKNHPCAFPSALHVGASSMQSAALIRR